MSGDSDPLPRRARSWVPFALALGALVLLHLHLQNYNVVTSDTDLGFKAPQPGDFNIQEMLEKALTAADKEKGASEATEVSPLSGTDREFLRGRKALVLPPGVKPEPEAGRKTKYILHWGEAYGSKKYGFEHGQSRFISNNCKVSDCETTDNRNKFTSVSEFDAIVFHQRSMSKRDLPKERKPHQKYIMWMMESASYPFGWHGNQYVDFFNWTMTYREDSDFFHPYGRIFNKKPHPADPVKLEGMIEMFGRNNKHIAQGKTKKVAWFVSNCRSMSGREGYVKKLQQYTQVDIYGGCGPFKCPRQKEDDCWKKIETEYKFYLSFENSICLDYVTEKFFNAMNRSIIPVTLGGTNYTNIAPTHSHIDVIQDYVDPKKLADYLLYLDANDDKYAEYFWWKPYYWDAPAMYERGQAWCELCERLHTQGEKPSSIHNLHDVWTTSAHCGNVSKMNGG